MGRFSIAITRIDIAVPARNEAACLPHLLAALDRAAGAVGLPVRTVILADGCTDASARIARDFRPLHMRIDVAEVQEPRARASAGRARRLAMDMAAMPGGLIMTTDADAVPDAAWIAEALDAAQAGADLVCGAISAHVPHVLATPSGARITQAEHAYADIQHDIRHALDQVAGRQPVGAPRPHYMESGASMAIRAGCYQMIGGLPPRDHSEDRALVHRVEDHGLTVRYVPDMRTHVSARLQGRATGGMAACLRHRMQDADPLADQAMLPAAMLGDLWGQAMAGAAVRYPDRSCAAGAAMRASDLERGLGALADLRHRVVRPDLARWLARPVPVAAQ